MAATYGSALASFAKKTKIGAGLTKTVPKQTSAGFDFADLPRFVQSVAPAPFAGLPLDLQTGLDVANQAADTNLNNTHASINGAEDRAANDYGYKVDYATDASTGSRTVRSLAVDPTNPYSRAAALQRNYDNSRAGATNGYAARGQLYSGALQNAQNESTRQFGEGDNQLKTAFQDFIARNEDARKNAVTAAESARVTNAANAASAAASRAPTVSAPVAVAAPAPVAPVAKPVAKKATSAGFDFADLQKYIDKAKKKGGK